MSESWPQPGVSIQPDLKADTAWVKLWYKNGWQCLHPVMARALADQLVHAAEIAETLMVKDKSQPAPSDEQSNQSGTPA